MKKIKICFAATYAWALFEPKAKIPFGGSEVQLYLLAKEIAKDDKFEVSFIVGDFGQKNGMFYNGVKLYKGYKPMSWEPSASQFTTRCLKAFIRTFKLWQALRQVQADIYIQYAAGAEIETIAFFCKLLRKKFVYMVASEIDVSGEYERINGLRGRLFGWGLRNAHLIILQHLQQKELLLKNYNKTGVLVRSPLYHIEDNTCKNSSTVKDSILWAGRTDPCKRPELFMELARQFPEEHFIMICPPTPFRIDLFGQIKELSKDIPNLEFIEYVPFIEVDRYFREAKVFVNTSDYEGFPNTFIQAAKNKTPILSFKVNPDDFINRYQCGFCAEGNFDRMVEQLRELLNNKTEGQEMGENAFRYAKENHDIKKVVPEFKKLLRSLVFNI